MNPYVRCLGPFRGELDKVSGSLRDRPFYSYVIRADKTGEIVLDGYAGDLQEAVHSMDLCLNFLVSQSTAD